MVRRLHEPDGPGHAGAARSRPSRARPVQRGDRVPAGVRHALRGRARTRAARARRAQPPDVGAQGAGRRGRPAAGVAGRSAARARRRRVRGDADRVHPRARRDPELLPALLLPDLRGARASAHRKDARRGGDGDRGGPARALQGPDPRHEAEAARRAGRRLLLRCGRRADRLAARGHGRRAGGERPQRRGDPEPRTRRRRGGDVHRGSRRRAPVAGRAARARDARARGPRQGLREADDRRPRCRAAAPTRSWR